MADLNNPPLPEEGWRARLRWAFLVCIQAAAVGVMAGCFIAVFFVAVVAVFG